MNELLGNNNNNDSEVMYLFKSIFQIIFYNNKNYRIFCPNTSLIIKTMKAIDIETECHNKNSKNINLSDIINRKISFHSINNNINYNLFDYNILIRTR